MKTAYYVMDQHKIDKDKILKPFWNRPFQVNYSPEKSGTVIEIFNDL